MATMITGYSKVKKYDLKSVWFSDITDQALFGVKTEHPSYDVFILLLSTSKHGSLEAERRYSKSGIPNRESGRFSLSTGRIPTVKLKILEKAFLKSESRISVTFKL